MPIDPAAALAAAEAKRVETINEAAGAAMQRVVTIADKALDDHDDAALAKLLGTKTAPAAADSDTSGDDATRTPHPKRTRGGSRSSGTRSSGSRSSGTRRSGTRRTRRGK